MYLYSKLIAKFEVLQRLKELTIDKIGLPIHSVSLSPILQIFSKKGIDTAPEKGWFFTSLFWIQIFFHRKKSNKSCSKIYFNDLFVRFQ